MAEAAGRAGRLQEVVPDSDVPAKMIDILRDVVVAQLHVR